MGDADAPTQGGVGMNAHVHIGRLLIPPDTAFDPQALAGALEHDLRRRLAPDGAARGAALGGPSYAITADGMDHRAVARALSAVVTSVVGLRRS